MGLESANNTALTSFTILRYRFPANRFLKNQPGQLSGKPSKWIGRTAHTPYWRTVTVMEILGERRRKGRRKTKTRTEETRGSTSGRKKRVSRLAKRKCLKGNQDIFYQFLLDCLVLNISLILFLCSTVQFCLNSD